MNELRDPSFGVLLLVHQQIIYVYCDGSIKRADAARVDTPHDALMFGLSTACFCYSKFLRPLVLSNDSCLF